MCLESSKSFGSDVMKALFVLSLFFLSLALCFVSLHGLILSCCAYDGSIKVGMFYYTWYDTNYDSNWGYPKIHDIPVLGKYNGSEESVILQHFRWIEDLYVDYLMLNWMGVNSFSDNCSEQIFAVAKENCTNLKFAIMVEPYNETEGGYDYEEIYGHVWNTFVSPYLPYYYYTWERGVYRPVLFIYNGAYLSGDTYLDFPMNDSFNIKFVGHREYVDFWYDDTEGWQPSYQPWGSAYSVLPRFEDDWRADEDRHTPDLDRDLSEGVYQQYWDRALAYARKGEIDWLNIVTWNEFPERTAIEPHFDTDAWNSNPYYLYNVTRENMLRLRGLEQGFESPNVWYRSPYTFGLVMFGVALGLYFFKRRY